ncbi:hypothetical protein BHM03_00032898 [Ensete ventricosum]|nr:hypothetical protein BHM03_00032898 [Ensete ventricosum]
MQGLTKLSGIKSQSLVIEVYFLVMHSWFYSEKRNRKKQHMNRESDVFESSEASDGPEDRKTEEKPSSYDDKNDLEEQVLDILL